VNVNDIVGTAEIADRLALSHAETVHAWRRRHADFPQPIAHVSGTYLWAWPDVVAWVRATGRAHLLDDVDRA
jgi:hypothetical protein